MKALKPNVSNRMNRLEFETFSKLQENVCIFAYKKKLLIHIFHISNTQLKESATLLLYLHFLFKRQLCVAIFLILGLDAFSVYHPTA